MSRQYIDKKGNKINVKNSLKRDTKSYGFYKLVKTGALVGILTVSIPGVVYAHDKLENFVKDYNTPYTVEYTDENGKEEYVESDADIINKLKKDNKDYELEDETYIFDDLDTLEAGANSIMEVTHNSKEDLKKLNPNIDFTVDNPKIPLEGVRVRKVKELTDEEREYKIIKSYYQNFLPKTEIYKTANGEVNKFMSYNYKGIFTPIKEGDTMYSKDIPYINALNIIYDYENGNKNNYPLSEINNMLSEYADEIEAKYAEIPGEKIGFTTLDSFEASMDYTKAKTM